MRKKTLAYMLVNNNNTTLYPPLLTDNDTDFLVLTSLDSLQSDFWEIKIIPDLSNIEFSIKANPKSYLGDYDEYIYIESEQIIYGKLSIDKNCIISIPTMESLLPTEFHLSKIEPETFCLNPQYTDGKYNGYPLQLSICLLMSNRRDTVRNCLESLKPLLTELDAELIIVDSSSDGSTEIAQEYGATVIPYIWVNDFASARNTAIQVAKGAWILSIDDDEWFEDTAEIIKFFKSNQWEKCDTAFYKVRNYNNINKDDFNECVIQRMAKNSPNLHYIFPIHEAFDFSFINHKPTSKYFNCFVHHYGYAYKNETEKEKKIYRNIAGLYTTLSLFPYDLRQHQQLCNELTILRNFSAAKAYTFKLLALCMLLKKESEIEALHWKRIAVVFLYTIGQLSGDHSLITSAKELTQWNELNTFQSATVYYYLLVHAFNTNVFEDVCTYAKKYYSYRKEYLKASNKHMLSLSIFIDLVEPKDKFNSLLVSHAYAALQLNQERQVDILLEQIDLNYLDKHNLAIIIKIYFSLPNNLFIKHFPHANNAVLEGLYQYAKKTYNESTEFGITPSLVELDEKVMATDSFTNNPYVHLIHLYSGPSNSSSYDWFLNNPIELNQFIDDIMLCAVINDIYPLKALLIGVKLEAIERASRSLKSLTFDRLRKVIDKNLPSVHDLNLDDFTIKEIYFFSAILEMILFSENYSLSADDCISYKIYFIKYINLINLLSSTTNTIIMFSSEYFDLLPATTRGAYYIKNGLQHKESNNLKEYMNCLKAAVEECSLFDAGVKLLLTELKEYPSESPISPKTEFEILGEQLKATAKQMISSGEFADAENILSQLSKLLPNDKELDSLLSLCYSSLLVN